MTLTSTGLGIGSNNPQGKLVVSNSGAEGCEISPGSGFVENLYYNRATSSYVTAQSFAALHRWGIAGNEAMRLDASSRLLVGTSSAVSNLEPFTTPSHQFVGNDTTTGGGMLVLGKTAHSNLYLSRGQSGNAVSSGDLIGRVSFTGYDGGQYSRFAAISCEADAGVSSSDSPGRLVFSTTADGASSPTERVRIGQSGFTKISNSATYNDTAGTYHELVTTLTGSNNVLFRAPASYGSDNIKSFVLTAAGTGFNHFLADSNGTTVCVIRGNGNLGNTNNVYTSLSDSKLKENIIDAGSQWSDIKSLQVRKYNFKEETKYETHTQIGLVAQEVELVSPGLIEEYPDRDADGNDLGTTTKSVKYSVLYMKAVKALQEAMERIEALEAKVAALEAA
jgi:hypothetical protein